MVLYYEFMTKQKHAWSSICIFMICYPVRPQFDKREKVPETWASDLSTLSTISSDMGLYGVILCFVNLKQLAHFLNNGF